jgi:phage-related baseplate assembly protein
VLQAIEASLAALVEKQRWLGYDHMRSAIHAAAHLQDVHTSEVLSPPEDVRVSPVGVVKVKSITVTYAGRRE